MPRRRSRSNHGPLERQARAILTDTQRTIARLPRECAASVAEAAEAMIACLERGGTIYFCGNGGSAADSQHFACELAGRFLLDRPALAAIALTTNTSSLTAIGNDYGYDLVFSRQLDGLGIPGDVLVAISTSGGARNVMKAIASARRLGMTVIGMTGLKGKEFAAKCDIAMVTPSRLTPRVQEGHLAMAHAYCELIESALFAAAGAGPPPSRARRESAARPTVIRAGTRTSRKSGSRRARSR